MIPSVNREVQVKNDGVLPLVILTPYTALFSLFLVTYTLTRNIIMKEKPLKEGYD